MDDVKMVHGIRLIRLSGTRHERGIQHGKIVAALTEADRQGLALGPLAKKNQWLIAQTARSLKGMGSILAKFYEAFVLKQFMSLPLEYKSRLNSFKKASKLSDSVLWLALFQPDFLMVLAAVSSERIRSQLMSGMPGCSTAIYRNDDSMLFFRNLDYPAAAHWEKYPAVFYVEPNEPDLQNYVSISSLGIHTPGLTGFNEAGIAFSLHAQFSKHVSVKGVPIFFLGEDILERATSLDEAIALCRSFKPIGNWTLNVASFNENKAASIEISEGRVNVRPLETLTSESYQSVCHANGFQNPDFQKNELHFSGSFIDDVRGRKNTMDQTRVTQLIEGLNLMASHIDSETGETRIFGNTISVVTTIQSVAIDLSHQALYVSNRNESPTSLGPYVKLPLRYDDLATQTVGDGTTLTVEYSPDFISALHAYHHAYINWQVIHQPSRKKRTEITHAYLIQATEILASDPHLWMMRGYFELMHDEVKAALKCFQTASTFKMSEHHQKVAFYFKAACLDLLGDRVNAVRYYSEILASLSLDEKLQKKAEKRLVRPFKRAYCQKIEPDLQFVEPLEYR
jgi:hypothetical protein